MYISTIGLGISLSTILITILVIIINSKISNPNDSDKWDIVEYLFAIFFGWIAVVYILLTYGKYIFGDSKYIWTYGSKDNGNIKTYNTRCMTGR